MATRQQLKGRTRPAPAFSIAGAKARKLSAVVAERDAALERLKETVTEQTSQIAELEKALADAKFQTGILEQSYAKQLSEARDRADCAEKCAYDRSERISELEAREKELSSELADAKSRLDLFGPEAGSIDEMLESFSKPKEQPHMDELTPEVDPDDDAKRLEEMLAPDLMFAAKRKESS